MNKKIIFFLIVTLISFIIGTCMICLKKLDNECLRTKKLQSWQKNQPLFINPIPKDLAFSGTVLSQDPFILYLTNFLSNDECDYLIQYAGLKLNPSTVQGKNRNEYSAHRTSFTANLKKHETNVIKTIEERCCQYTRLPITHLEPLQVVRYQPGQYFKPHYDYFVPGKTGTYDALKRGGQRTITIFAYLNSAPMHETQSCTVFPKLHLHIPKPKKGCAVLFFNTLPNNTEDTRTMHGGDPPLTFTKYGLNVWFRQLPFH